MALDPPVYDLVLLLDAALDEDRRHTILDDVEHAVEKHGGDIVSRHEWGVRPTTFEIDKKAEAEYHLLQFHATNELLLALDHSLKITDGVLRHRVIKLRRGTPAPPDLTPAAVAAAAAEQATAAPEDDE